jgi:hypothetical protein
MQPVRAKETSTSRGKSFRPARVNNAEKVAAIAARIFIWIKKKAVKQTLHDLWVSNSVFFVNACEVS